MFTKAFNIFNNSIPISKSNMLKVRIIIILFALISMISCNEADLTPRKAQTLVKRWSKQIGEELLELSHKMTRKDQITNEFAVLKNRIYRDKGRELIERVAENVRVFMVKKNEAVQNIASYAEFLSYHQSDETVDPHGSYHFYNADNITKTTWDTARADALNEQITENECQWWCHQKNIDSPILNKSEIVKLFSSRHTKDVVTDCNCVNLISNEYDVETYNWVPLEHDHSYNQKINKNLSVVKVYAGVYERDPKVLEGIRWSEALDLRFKKNLEEDPTLKFQYFASPLGYMRHYPAVQWSKERYDITYDPRTRSWYTEAMTSPKDMVILLDRSGSMCKEKKRSLAAHIVNNILDTLNDNDFVNIYTFTNTTEPLIPCFEDTLVQANEENLRLFRDSLGEHYVKFVADISLGLNKAFELLGNFRNHRNGSQCNQAIMLITDGLDYNYKQWIFNDSNWQLGTPVRIFTYTLGNDPNDEKEMEWIACNNRGYFVNITLPQEVRDKVLPYMNVMSRPINLDKSNNQTNIWSYLYIDLADRRYSNWLWHKFEGNRQREIFRDHAKREVLKLQLVLTAENHILLEEEHEYEQYQNLSDFDYMTTVSIPVYGRRRDDVDLIGVAGVDVPIKLLNSLIPHHKLGVNGYAFILTNNGYVLMHPGHRREFEKIPKPTFNRVDFVEVEISDHNNLPRKFDKSIVELRERMVGGVRGEGKLKVKFAVDDMKRIILSERRYYFTKTGPFTLGIALPEAYGLMVVNHTESSQDITLYRAALLKTKNWSAHPNWIYVRHKAAGKTMEETIVAYLKSNPKQRPLPLLTSFLVDGNLTAWFENKIPGEEKFVKAYDVDNVFVATHSGLTRWRNDFAKSVDNAEDLFKKFTPFRGTKAIDEDWYKRVVEYNFYKEGTNFVYSVPFEISGYENDTMITSTHGVFVDDESGRTPIAAVGLQFNHRAMYSIYQNITTKCDGHPNCLYGCHTDYLQCFILDNNAYVILSDNIEHTGRFIGDIRPDIMYHLLENRVYKETQMFDYQATCHNPVPESKGDCASSAGTAFKLRQVFENLWHVAGWALATILMMLRSVGAGKDYQTVRDQGTLAYERLALNKTSPTPCDQEMWLYTLEDKFNTTDYTTGTKFDCAWPYVVEKIPNSNLLFMAMNNASCKVDPTKTIHKSPTPSEINYNISLPCYIGNFNNFTRKTYMNCFNQSHDEDILNGKSHYFCGRTWK